MERIGYLATMTCPAITFLQGQFKLTKNFIETIQNINSEIDLNDTIIEINLIQLKDIKLETSKLLEKSDD